MSNPLVLAEIVGVYGVKGWVKLKVWVEDLSILERLKRIELAPGKALREQAARQISVSELKQHGKGVVARLEGVDDRTAAEALRGWQLRADETLIPAAGPGEYYWRELVGLQVWCREAGEETLLGEVDHLLETGANDVLVVKATPDSVDDRERLVPWLPGEVIDTVDLEAGSVTVDWFVDA